MAYLDSHGLSTLWTKIKTTFAKNLGIEAGTTTVSLKLKDGADTPNQLASVDIPHATANTAGVMSNADYSKLDGIESGANKYVHPTTAGNKHIPAGGATGQILTFESAGTAKWADAPDTGVTKIVAGTNVTLSPTDGVGEVTVSAKDTVYTHPSHTAKSSGLYKVTVDALGHVSAAAAVEKSDITGLGIPAQDTTYTFNTAYNASTNKAATMADINSAMASAAKYKGTLGTEAEFKALTNYKIGDYYVISASFTHAIGDSKTVTLDAGNMVFCNTASATYNAEHFDIVQADIEAIPDSVINALS